MGYFGGNDYTDISNANMAVKNAVAYCELKGISLDDLASELNVKADWFRREHNDISANKYFAMVEYLGLNGDELWDKNFAAWIRAEELKKKIESLKGELADLENSKVSEWKPKYPRRKKDPTPIMEEPEEDNE